MKRSLAFLCVLFPASAFALSITSLPVGMCVLDVNKPAERMIFETLQTAIQGDNELRVAFGDCDELTALDKGEREDIAHYGTILEQRTSIDTPRDQYIGLASQLVANSDLAAQATGQAKIAADEALHDQQLSGAGTLSAGKPNVLYQDTNMVVIGITQRHEVNGKPVQVASTAGMTLIAKHPVSVNLYAPAEQADAFKRSRGMLVNYIPELIKANP